MSKPVFDFEPDLSGNGKKVKFDVRVVKFGNGYEQRQQTGLKPAMRTWDLKKTGSKALIDEIEAFFYARKGIQSFYWTPPGENRVTVRCAEEYTRDDLGGGFHQISFQFLEVLA